MIHSLRRLLVNQDLDGFWNKFFDFTETPGFHTLGEPWRDEDGAAALGAAIATALGQEGPVAMMSTTYIEGGFVHSMAAVDGRLMAVVYFPESGLGSLAVLRTGGGAEFYEFFVGEKRYAVAS